MKRIYYFFTKYCFLTAFFTASIIWSVLSYNNFYERFNKVSLIDRIGHSVMIACNDNTDVANLKVQLEDMFDDENRFSISILKFADDSITKQPEIIYANTGYKRYWHKINSHTYAQFNCQTNDGKWHEYGYNLQWQYKDILPMALVRVWTFSIIPHIAILQYKAYITNYSMFYSILKRYLWQSFYFWIMVLVFWKWLLFYKGELNIK